MRSLTLFIVKGKGGEHGRHCIPLCPKLTSFLQRPVNSKPKIASPPPKKKKLKCWVAWKDFTLIFSFQLRTKGFMFCISVCLPCFSLAVFAVSWKCWGSQSTFPLVLRIRLTACVCQAGALQSSLSLCF